MRYRLLATYQGAPYEAGIGPDDTGVVLFAACPPPEELRFEPATGHWRKRVNSAEVQTLYESRPVGTFRGESCVVLDDLTDRLHIAYLGHDAYRAEQLGYWEVDRGVFELMTPRNEVTEIVEQRLPIALRAAASPRSRQADALGHSGEFELGPANGFRPSVPPASQLLGFEPDGSGMLPPAADDTPLPLEAEAMRAATAGARANTAISNAPAGLSQPSSAPPPRPDSVTGMPSWSPQAAGLAPPAGPRSVAGDEVDIPLNGAGRTATAGPASLRVPSGTGMPPTTARSGPALRFGDDAGAGTATALAARPVAASVPIAPAPPVIPDVTPKAPRRRGSRRRMSTQRIFSELAEQAAIPADSYAINEDVDGAMCLVRTDEGFEVFNSLAGARHEVRGFQDEESAYFYLFGVLVAEAVRTGALAPRH